MNYLLNIGLLMLVSFNPIPSPFSYGMPNSAAQAEAIQNWFRIKYGDCVFESQRVDLSLQYTRVIAQTWRCSKNHMECIENWIEVDYGKSKGKRLGHNASCGPVEDAKSEYKW